MSDVQDIADKIAATLAPLNTTTLGQWVTIRSFIKGDITPPVIQVFPSEIQYDIANDRGGDQINMTVQALIAANYDEKSQAHLYRLVRGSGPLSVKALIEADSDLGGTVDDLRVTECTGFMEYRPAGKGAVIGASWTVQVETQTEEG